jgi:hypothetical protein
MRDIKPSTVKAEWTRIMHLLLLYFYASRYDLPSIRYFIVIIPLPAKLPPLHSYSAPQFRLSHQRQPLCPTFLPAP